MLLEISGEITPERMKGWSQSKNNTQLWIDSPPTNRFITDADFASTSVNLAIPLFISTIPTYSKTTPSIFTYLLFFKINYIFELKVILLLAHILTEPVQSFQIYHRKVFFAS